MTIIYWLALVPFSAVVGSVVCAIGETCVAYSAGPITMVSLSVVSFAWGLANILSR